MRDARQVMPLLVGFLVCVASAASYADNCEPIRTQIESKFKAGGITNFTVTTVDAETTPAGKVVGSCANGTKRIIFVPGAQTAVKSASAASPVAPANKTEKAILTECKDGTVSSTGSCKK